MAGAKSQENEYIVLDAVIEDVLDTSAFRARLRNGHPLVAYIPRPQRDGAPPLRRGRAIRVKLSPADMGRGEVVDGMEQVKT